MTCFHAAFAASISISRRSGATFHYEKYDDIVLRFSTATITEREYIDAFRHSA